MRDAPHIRELQCNLDCPLSNIEHFPFDLFYHVAIGLLDLNRETLIVELCYPLPECEQRSVEMEGYCAISEDLTGDTYKKMKELLDHQDVAKVWTIDGRIRFIRADDSNNQVRKVKSIYDPMDVIVNSK
jgi:hypothetical protein